MEWEMKGRGGEERKDGKRRKKFVEANIWKWESDERGGERLWQDNLPFCLFWSFWMETERSFISFFIFLYSTISFDLQQKPMWRSRGRGMMTSSLQGMSVWNYYLESFLFGIIIKFPTIYESIALYVLTQGFLTKKYFKVCFLIQRIL